MAESSPPFGEYRSDSTLVNALVGGVVAAVLSFVPGSPVLGGFVAGYLQVGDRRDGVRVGAWSGVVALVPAVLFGFVFLAFLGFGFAAGAGRATVFFLFVALFVAILGALYTIGFGALGGYLGAIVAEEYAAKQPASERETGAAARESSAGEDREDAADDGDAADDEDAVGEKDGSRGDR